MPEKQDSPGFAGKPGSVNNVGASIQQRNQQPVVIIRIIFKICILNNDVIARNSFEPGTKRSAFAAIDFVVQSLQIRALDSGL